MFRDRCQHPAGACLAALGRQGSIRHPAVGQRTLTQHGRFIAATPGGYAAVAASFNLKSLNQSMSYRECW